MVHELAFEARHSEAQKLRLRGQRAFQKARQYDIRPVDLVAVRHGIAEQVSLHLREAGLLPAEEANDGFILVSRLHLHRTQSAVGPRVSRTTHKREVAQPA